MTKKALTEKQIYTIDLNEKTIKQLNVKLKKINTVLDDMYLIIQMGTNHKTSVSVSVLKGFNVAIEDVMNYQNMLQ